MQSICFTCRNLLTADHFLPLSLSMFFGFKWNSLNIHLFPHHWIPIPGFPSETREATTPSWSHLWDILLLFHQLVLQNVSGNPRTHVSLQKIAKKGILQRNRATVCRLALTPLDPRLARLDATGFSLTKKGTDMPIQYAFHASKDPNRSKQYHCQSWARSHLRWRWKHPWSPHR